MMHGTASIKDELISVGQPLPKIAKAVPLDAQQIKICWQSGAERTVDLAPVLSSRNLFAPLRSDDALFRQLIVNEDGNALEWPGGIELSAVWIANLPSVA